MSLWQSIGAARRQAARLGRTLRTAVSQARATLVYHMDYEAPENPLVDTRRGQHILSYLRREGCVSRKQLRRPRPIGLPDLALVHDYAYLESVGEAAVLERIFGEGIHGLDQERLIESQRRMVAGTVLAARMAVRPWRQGRPVVNLGGGLHHAHPDRGGGFCLFNDVAVAVRRLRGEGWRGRVLVVDLDLHQGDGTRRIFAEDPSVYTFSIHGHDWEDHGATADLNVPLGTAVGDAAYLEALREHLPRAVREAQPDLVFYVAGVDVAADDQLGSWRVSHDGIFARDREVLAALGDRAFVWLLAGGYGPDAWRHSARSLAWLLAGYDQRIPSRAERDLSHFRRISRQFTRRELSREGAEEDDDLVLTPEDLMLDVVGAPRHTKLLGYYSLYGIELAFERYGALPKIRRAGYPEVTFELQTDHPTGERLRIHSRDERRDLLLEMVVRETASLAPFRMLAVEWLLLQDPRREPTASRPLLPGQQYPGMGILREVVGMVVMICERLGFDGMLFSPAHYHVAAQAHSLLAFVDPVEEARFQAIAEALAGLPLAEVTQEVHGDGLWDGLEEAPLRWHAVPMVFPVSEACRARYRGDLYDRAVQEAGRWLQISKRNGRGDPAGP